MVIILDWIKQAEKLKFDDGMSWTAVTAELKHLFPELSEKQALEKIRTRLRKGERYKRSKGCITYEDKKEPTEQDIEDFYSQIKATNNALMKLEKKQTETTINIDDDKPIAISFWGDWHIGSKGLDYEQFDKDLELINNTDGLYCIGMGDYKENNNALVHPSSSSRILISQILNHLLCGVRVNRKHFTIISYTPFVKVFMNFSL